MPSLPKPILDASIQLPATLKPMSATTVVTPLPSVIKGDADWRTYRPFLLSNGLVCLAVHDAQSKTTAMSVCVQAGASSDPRTFSGLAHFTEHMCFLGSHKYPLENEYKRYLSLHGGRSNASTSMSYTTYKFDVMAEHAQQAVDIFSNFFVSPLFTQSGTSREVNAVDSENSKNLTTDARRRLQVLKALADPDHHYSKFSTGHKGTLGHGINNALKEAADLNGKEQKAGEEEFSEDAKKVREALLAFHRRHYRPENMVCVIVGPQSLDTLQEWIIPRFASIVDQWAERLASGDLTEVECLIDEAAKDAPEIRYDEPVPSYNPAFRSELQGGKWPFLLTTLPLMSMRKLVLNFPMPSVQKMPDQSPISIISHFLGHEGPGSSFAILQDLGLVSSISTGPRISSPDMYLLQIDVNLTQEGEDRWKEVVQLLFDHCRLIHDTAFAAVTKGGGEENTARKDLERIWGELAKIQAMHFHQSSPGAAYDFAPELAQSVVMQGCEKCISAGRLLEESKETLPLDALMDFSARLTPKDCFIERCSQGAWDEQIKTVTEKHMSGHFGLKTEKWYGVEYFLSPIDDSVIERWEDERLGGDPSVVSQRKLLGNLHLPRPNQYLPRTLELCFDLPEEAKHGPRIEKEIDPPKLLVDDNGIGRLWHRLDDRYALPKSSLTFMIRNASVEHRLKEGKWSYDVSTSLNSMILTGVFSDALAQDTYDASLAGLHWNLSKSSAGLSVTVGGYSDRVPDLALKIIQDFFLLTPLESANEKSSFLKASHVSSTLDRVVRSLKTFFESRRADSHALYYRDLVMSSQGKGVADSLLAAEDITLDSVLSQHRHILQNPSLQVECLFTGNVSEKDARNFFSSALGVIKEATSSVKQLERSSADKSWVPGPMLRKLIPGEDLELHFTSKNTEEQNGAVLVTFQSPVPGFKGKHLSSLNSLRYTAGIRLLCHIMREPLFDELRTKQQLGYIVSSYYDLGFAVQQQAPQYIDNRSATEYFPSMTPVDSIVVNILSKKVSPPEAASRVEEFLTSFREKLAMMPLSEIKDHGDSLSKKMLKPIQNLGNEAEVHFGKIRRYSPEILSRGGTDKELPWDSVKTLAHEIQVLGREDILKVWDTVIANKDRMKILSCVYGSTFPLPDCKSNSKLGVNVQPSVFRTIDELLAKRNDLMPYDANGSLRVPARVTMLAPFDSAGLRRTAGIASVVALFGMGFLLFSLHDRKLTRGNKK